MGQGQAVDSLERMNRQMAGESEAFRASRKAPPSREEGQIVVLTADNKGVPMRRPADQRPVGSHRKKGEKANKKQLATLGTVYTVDRNVRSAGQVVAALFRDDPGQKGQNPPVAQHKRTWASLNREEGGQVVLGEDRVFGWMAEEESRRNPHAGKDVVFLADGGRSLWTAMERHLDLEKRDIVEILDLIHVAPRLWDAAHIFHGEGSEKAAEFVRKRLRRILEGEVGYVIGGLRQMGSKRALRGRKAADIARICNFLARHRDKMKYDEYLAAGYPIASGVIEGACRHVVKDRMEREGMRWTVEGAQAMLDLRTTYINGQWDDFQRFRIKRETKRIYPHSHALDTVPWPIAA